MTDVPPMRISRHFAAPRALVFKAWSSPDHVCRWFSPHDYSVPEAIVELHPGGTFSFRMLGPDGFDNWSRGKVVEVVQDERLVVDFHVDDAEGKRLFDALTEVDFTDDNGGTRLDIVQSYKLSAAEAKDMTAGAHEGWSQTLDKLAAEVERMSG